FFLLFFACNRCWCPSGTWIRKPRLNPPPHSFTTTKFLQITPFFADFTSFLLQIITVSPFLGGFWSSLRLYSTHLHLGACFWATPGSTHRFSSQTHEHVLHFLSFLRNLTIFGLARHQIYR